MTFRPFAMERWQSTHENQVAFNLSESGVRPLTTGELLDLAGHDADLSDILLGYGQTNGSDELRARIAAMYDHASADNVVVTNGSAEANFVALWETLRPADEVVSLVPAYMQGHGLADAFGANVREVQLREHLGWQPDPDDITRAVTHRTRLILVTNPNNPTGAVLAPEPRNAIVAAAERTGAWILADEVYTGAELDGARTPSFWHATDRVIATGSLSKAYGLPGLRIGWAVAPTEYAERLWARSDYTTIAPSVLCDRLAAIALEPDARERLYHRARTILQTSLRQLDASLAGNDALAYRHPDAGAICYVRYSLPVNSTALAERLRQEQNLLIVPGDHFGMDHWFRIGYAFHPEKLETALHRLQQTLAAVPA